MLDIEIAILLSAIGGFFISFYIWKKKSKKEVLLCPLGMECDKIVKGEYSKTFGIGNEVAGMGYFGAVSIFYISAIFYPEILISKIFFTFAISTVFSFIFSLYLLYIQFFKIKEKCTWCILSAVCSAIIFAGAMTIFVNF